MPLKNAYLIVAASFLWLIGGMAIFNRIDPPAQSPLCHFLVWTVLAGFGVIFLAGTGVWAGAKGYHVLVGIALGWVGPIGLLILAFLPDKSSGHR